MSKFKFSFEMEFDEPTPQIESLLKAVSGLAGTGQERIMTVPAPEEPEEEEAPTKKAPAKRTTRRAAAEKKAPAKRTTRRAAAKKAEEEEEKQDGPTLEDVKDASMLKIEDFRDEIKEWMKKNKVGKLKDMPENLYGPFIKFCETLE